jgi:N-methylhydantoinase B
MIVNSIELAIFKSAMHSIAEEMGAALRRTAFSPNIKERRDYSCAIFNGDGDAIAMGDHMPVHLGSMPMSVREAIDHVDLGRGDVAILNDPYAGGTHLPDITMVLPVFADDEGSPTFYVAARAHHADVGGYYPGSMGPCREIYQEGIRIPPVKIVQGGAVVRDVLNLLLYNVRTPEEREGDLFSQIGACKVGEARLRDVITKYGSKVVELSKELLDYSERLVRAELARMPVGTFAATDFLDDDGLSETPIAIRVSIQIDPSAQSAKVDFSGSDAQINSSINAVYAITYSAVYYVFRCLLSDEAPASSGIMRPIQVIAPIGTNCECSPTGRRGRWKCRNFATDC